jgi:protein-tyrosine phosphatase
MYSIKSRSDSLVSTNYGTWKGLVRYALAQGQWLAGGLDDVVCPDLSRVERLVFVCLGNINRSCFAEAVAKRMGATTASFGLSTTTGAPAFSQALITARQFQLELDTHRATDMTDHQARPGDLLLAMEVRHVRRLQKCAPTSGTIALLGGWGRPQRLHLHDPHTLSPQYFQTCFSIIESATRQLVLEWQRQRGVLPR